MALKFLNNGYFAGKVGIGVANPGVKLQVLSASEQLTNFSSSVADQLAYSQINASSSTTGTITAAAALELVGQANASGHGRHAWIGAEGTSNTTFETKLKFKIRGDASGYDWSGSAEAPTIMTLEGTGNVGIGTTSPSATLELNSDTGNAAKLKIGRQNTATNYLELGTSGGSSVINAIGIAGVNASLIFNRSTTTVTTQSMIIDGDGNVGIGITDPILKLHIEGTNSLPATSGVAQNGGIRIENGVNNGVLDIGASNATGAPGWLQATDKADLSQAYKLLLNPNGGNVGIGTTNPGVKLDVSENAAGLVSAITNSNGGGSGVQITAANGTNNSLQVRNYAGGELMRVQGDGDVGIGATVPGARLHVKTEGGSTTTPNLVLIVQANTASTISTGGGTSIEFKGVSSGGNIQNYQQARIRSVGQAANNAHGFAIDVKPNAATALTERLFLSSGGALRLSSYGAGTLVTDASGNITVSSGGGAGGPYLPLAGGTMTGTGSIVMPDDFKLQLGNGIFSIFNDGTYSIIRSANEPLLIDSNGITFRGYAPYDTLATITSSGISIKSALLSNQENTNVDTGTEAIASVVLATYTAAFFDFVIKKGTNVRSGTVYACHDGTSVAFTETSTQDLGDTSDVTLNVVISTIYLQLQATTTSDDWIIKSLIRAI